MSSRPQSPHHLAARECPRVRTHIAAPRGSQLHGRAPVFVASRSWRRSHAVCMTRLRTPSSFSAHAHAHLMGSSPRCHSSDLCVSACVRGVHAWAGAAWAHDPRRRLLCRRLIRADAQDNDPAHPVARGQQGLSACTTHYYRMRNAYGRHASASSHDSIRRPRLSPDPGNEHPLGAANDARCELALGQCHRHDAAGKEARLRAERATVGPGAKCSCWCMPKPRNLLSPPTEHRRGQPHCSCQPQLVTPLHCQSL